MMSILFFLLCSGCFQLTCAANRLRYIRNLTHNVNWSNALNECSKTGESLVTLYDQQDIDIGKASRVSNYWIGLHKYRSNVTTWSNGDQFIFNDSNVHIKPGEQICEALEDGEWKGFNCSERKPFMCQKDNNYTLINKRRNWCQALQYCRAHSSDLASISDDQQNEHLKNESRSKTFWIGLLHDEWEWADKSCSTYRRWGTGQPRPGSCGKLSPMSLTAVECQWFNNILCSKGSVRIIAVSDLLTWEGALDYCEDNHTRLLWIEDQDDQKAVEQWLGFIDDSSYSETLWIGLRQSSVFGFWIWSDRIVNWNKWKGNRIPELSPTYSHCGVISANGTWSAENCERTRSFLCEEHI